jgi:hypothetical protein
MKYEMRHIKREIERVFIIFSIFFCMFSITVPVSANSINYYHIYNCHSFLSENKGFESIRINAIVRLSAPIGPGHEGERKKVENNIKNTTENVNYVSKFIVINATLFVLTEGMGFAVEAIGGRIMLRALSKEALKGVEMAAETGATVLGKYPEYINLAEQLGAKRFSVPLNIWNKMSAAEQWSANQKFLDRMIMRGDNIILSNPVLDVNKVSGAFRQELDYIIGKGYRLNSTGTQLIK